MEILPRNRSFVIAASLSTALAAAAFGQTCPGDCNHTRSVTAGEITRMVAVVLQCNGSPAGCALVPGGCVAGDTDGSGSIDVADLMLVIQNVLRFERGCDPQVPPTTSHTPVPPTATPLPPSVTATSAATATATVEPSSTPTATFTLTETPLPPAATATATPSRTPTVGAAVCGNGTVEAGESCDDGNTVTNPPADTCPADCTVVTCSPSGMQRTIAINFSAPVGVASIAVRIVYPDGVVQIPGTATDASVLARVTNRPGGFLADAVDFDYALRVAFVGTRAISGTQLCRVNFDTCRDALAPIAGDFGCQVLEANDTNFQPVNGATCSITFP